MTNTEAVVAFRNIYLPGILAKVEAALELGNGVRLLKEVTLFERERGGEIERRVGDGCLVTIEISDSDPGEGWGWTSGIAPPEGVVA